MVKKTIERADIRPLDHEERMSAAKARAGWELGSSAWAGRLINAYLFPDGDREALKREMGES